MYVKVFIGYIRLELDLQDFKALACQKELSALVDNNFSWRLKPNSGIIEAMHVSVNMPFDKIISIQFHARF